MSIKKWWIIGPLLVLLNLQTYAQQQDTWDLKRCVEYAVSNNVSVKQQDVQARLAELVFKQNKLSQIPTLSLNGNLSLNSGYTQNPQTFGLSTSTLYYNSYGLSSNVNFFNFNSLRNAIAGSRFAWQAANAATENIRNNVSLNVANAYLNFLLTNEQAKTAELQLRYSQASLANTQRLVGAGSIPELNAAELESQVAQDSSAYVTALSNVSTAVLNVKAYMSFDAAVAFVLDTPSVDKIPIEKISNLQPDLVYNLALVNQPLQKVDELNIKSATKYVAANHGAMYPTFSLFGQLGSTYTNQTKELAGYNLVTPTFPLGNVTVSGSTYDVYQNAYQQPYYKNQAYFSQLNTAFKQALGLSVNIPILNGGSLRTSWMRSRLNLRNYELQRDLDNLTLKQNIYQAYNLAVAAYQKSESNKKTVEATQRSFEYAQKRYDVGLLNTIDLLTNQNNYFKAKNDLIYSQFDFVFKMKVLEFYKGQGIKL
jgi:outer membrane protein